MSEPSTTSTTSTHTNVTPMPLTAARATEARVAELASRYVNLDADRRYIVAELAEVKLELAELLDRGRHQAGAALVTVSAPRRTFDPERARQVIPAELLASVTTSMVDRKLAQDRLTPEQYRACQVETPGASDDVRITVPS